MPLYSYILITICFKRSYFSEILSLTAIFFLKKKLISFFFPTVKSSGEMRSFQRSSLLFFYYFFEPTATGRKKEKAQLLEEVGPITCRKKMGCGFNVSVNSWRCVQACTSRTSIHRIQDIFRKNNIFHGKILLILIKAHDWYYLISHIYLIGIWKVLKLYQSFIKIL